MLQKEAVKLGHDISLIDAKTTQINTSSQIQDFDFGDVVLDAVLVTIGDYTLLHV